MNLLAVYFMPLDQALELRLWDVETADLITVITDEDTDAETSLAEAAGAWAERNGHTITGIDNQILRS